MNHPAAPGAGGPVLSRDQVIAALSEHFAADHIEMEELERRLDLAHRATVPEELRALLADLPSGVNVPAPINPTRGAMQSAASQSVPQAYSGPGRPVAAEHEVRDSQVVVGFMGGSTRGGSWVPARRITSVAVMGGVEIDFREARFAPGVTRLHVFAVWGGVDIIVPPDLRVECDGIGIMGGFEQETDPDGQPDPNGPVLRISGLACMGGAKVKVRHSGKTSRDARLRRKEHRKMLEAERSTRRRFLGR